MLETAVVWIKINESMLWYEYKSSWVKFHIWRQKEFLLKSFCVSCVLGGNMAFDVLCSYSWIIWVRFLPPTITTLLHYSWHKRVLNLMNMPQVIPWGRCLWEKSCVLLSGCFLATPSKWSVGWGKWGWRSLKAWGSGPRLQHVPLWMVPPLMW